MLKKVLCVSLSIFILFGVCGCMKYKNKSVTDAALEYMEKKYGEPFTYAAPWGESYSGTHQLMVTCESLTGRVLVEIENYREEGEVFRDNYIAVKYAQETLDLFQSYVDQEFGEGRVFYEVNPRGLSEDLPADATLEEYLADSRVPLAIFVEVSEDQFQSKDQVERLTAALAKYGFHFRLTVLVMNAGEYGILSLDELNDRISLREFVQCAKVTNLDDQLQVEWLGKE